MDPEARIEMRELVACFSVLIPLPRVPSARSQAIRTF